MYSNKIIDIIIALRPHHLSKNFLLFIPMVFSHQINHEIIFIIVKAFFSFSLVASGVYIINDLHDVKSDRLDKQKRKRPFASKKVSPKIGYITAIFLLFIGFILSYTLNENFLLITLFYFFLTTLYTFFIKKILVLDLLTLAILFTSRIIAGGLAAEIEVSIWLLTFSLFFFFSMASIKRQAEIKFLNKKMKNKIVGRDYIVKDLPVLILISFTSAMVSIVILVLYLNSEKVIDLYSRPIFLWGIILILLYWLSRIFLLTNRGVISSDPVIFAIKDKTSYLCLFLVTLLYLLAYFDFLI